MLYPVAAVEWAMKLQEVICRALAGTLTWLQAADILDIPPRTLRRWRARLERGGQLALYDRRRGRPSRRKAPAPEVQRVLRLYRERYLGFRVRHFHYLARRDHAVTLSYSFVKLALQEAGLVRKRRPRGRPRRRREPRPCFGELLHLDGSDHAWLALGPTERPTLIAVLDDATTRLLYAQLWPAETAHAILSALRAGLQSHGVPMALYTDRAGGAFPTPTAGGRVDPTHLTVVGRGLARLGIEHIPSYSPQARGRGERLNRTRQDRLINELRAAGISTGGAANIYLREPFIADYTAQFSRPPADPASAFVPVGAVDLDQRLCLEEDRTVAADNTVVFERVVLQLAKQPGRRSCAGLRVTVRRHRDGSHTVWRGPPCLGSYDISGQPLPGSLPRAAQGPPRLPRRQAVVRPTNARAHFAQDQTFRRRPGPDTPHIAPSRRFRLGPRLPVGPGL